MQKAWQWNLWFLRSKMQPICLWFSWPRPSEDKHAPLTTGGPIHLDKLASEDKHGQRQKRVNN